MIATKIVLKNSTVEFSNPLEAILFFLGQPERYETLEAHLMPHAIESLSSNWIENKQTFSWDPPNTLGIVNYSVDQENATQFAESLTFWSSVLPNNSTYSIEQYTVGEIPTNAVPIVVNESFYLSPDTVDDGLATII
jgi:hypothetical protein